MKPGSLVFEDVSKVYRWKGRRGQYETLKGRLFGRRSGTPRQPKVTEKIALKDINLDVRPGEVLAI
ncbi:MAG: hypothetical protein K8R59_06270, partial [Thermoanaerobaculales bacterium]|nr:hypothetical protein [Thermoanaerobaculales bacterium]